MRGAGRACLVALFALQPVVDAAGQSRAQERRNLQVVQSIYNTGKYGAGKWGARIAVAECRGIKDEEATIEAFKDSLRRAYGKHYEKYRDAIEVHLANPEIEAMFGQGQAFAYHRLMIADKCSELVLNQIVDENQRALENQNRSMLRMARTLGPN